MRINLNNLKTLLPLLFAAACEAPVPSQAQQTASDGSAIALPVRVERRVSLMGTWLSLEVDAGSRVASLRASEAALRAMEQCEARLSTWRKDSELAHLNRCRVGAPFDLTPLLALELKRAQELWSATQGAFDPGVGAVLEAWGVRSGGRVPAESELRQARAAGGFGALELAGATARRTHAGLQIEEGGFGKGAGLDRALEALTKLGVRSAFLDLGGQVALLGEESASLGLADPMDRERPLLWLSIDSGSLATSGNSERGFEVGGRPYSHLIDPRTGRPAADFGSLSVWAADATTADALSTGLYVMGPERALRWALEHDNIEIIVLKSLESGPVAIATPGWQGRIESLDPALKLQILDQVSQ